MSDGKEETSRGSIMGGLGGLFSKSAPQSEVVDVESEIQEDEVSVLRSMMNTQARQINELLEEKDQNLAEIERIQKESVIKLAAKDREMELLLEKVQDTEFVKAIIAENESIKKKNQQIMDRVAFDNVDKMEQSNRQLKNENDKLSEEIENVRQSFADLSQSFDEEKRIRSELDSELQKLRSEFEAKTQDLEKEKQMLEKAIEESQQLRLKNESMTSKVEQFDQEIERNNQKIIARHLEEIKKLDKVHAEQISKLEKDMDSLISERNCLSKQVLSIQKDLKALMRTGKLKGRQARGVDSFVSSLETENKHLMEDLARKNKSLADAIEALHVQMIESDIRSGALEKELVSKSDKTKDQLLQENIALRTLANGLSTDLQDKEVYVGELRRSLRKMGEELLRSESNSKIDSEEETESIED